MSLDLATLEAFDGSRASDAAAAAAAVTRALRQKPPVPAELAAARRALAVMLRGSVDAAAVAALVGACEAGVGVGVVDVFVVASDAWKVVVSAVVGGALVDGRVAGSVLRAAAAGVACMVRDARGATGGVAGRLGKIARFHAVNAARCAKRFYEAGVIADEELVGVLFALVGSVMALVSFNREVPGAIVDDLRQNLVPALAATLRAVLAMVPEEKFGQVVRGAAGLASVKEDFVIFPGFAASTRGLLVLFYLMRMAVAETPESTAAPDVALAKSESRLSALAAIVSRCETCLENVLLPLFFELLGSSYNDSISLRMRGDNTPLFEIAAACVADGAVALDSSGSPGVVSFLLTNLSSDNPLCGFAASEAIEAIARQRSASRHATDSLLLAVVAGAKLGLAAGCRYAIARWIPLACRIAAVYLEDGTSLDALSLCDNIAAVSDRSHNQGSAATDTHDPAELRIIAGVCRLIIERRNARVEGGVGVDAQAVVHGVLSKVGVAPEVLSALVKSSLLANSQGGRIAEAAVFLLPFVCEPRAAAGAALACIKRMSSPPTLIIAAFNSFNPGTMPGATLKAVPVEAVRIIKKHGPQVLPAVAAFVARAAASLHGNVSLAIWPELASLLETAVLYAAAPPAGAHPAICAAVMHHAAATLAVTGSIPDAGRNRSTHAALPPSILRTVEAALTRARTGAHCVPESAAIAAEAAAVAAVTQPPDLGLGAVQPALHALARISLACTPGTAAAGPVVAELKAVVAVANSMLQVLSAK